MGCVLFDLDGTLLDTLEDLTDAVNYALREFSYPERSLSEVRRFVGNGAEQLIRRATGQGDNWQAVLAAFRGYYAQHCRDKTRPYEGVVEALAQIGEKYPVAIVSNKPDSAVKALCADFFPGVYARGESSDCPRKPAPDMVRMTLEALGEDTCVYIGDSEVDVATARNAGAVCLCVLWGFRDRAVLEAAGGVHFCQTPQQLPELVQKLTAII